MIKNKFVVVPLLTFVLSSSGLFAANANISTLGQVRPLINYFFVGERVVATVTSNVAPDLTVKGSIGSSKYKAQQSNSITLRYSVTREDFKRGFVPIRVTFTSKSKRGTLDYYSRDIPVQSLDDNRRKEWETGAKQAERLLRGDFGPPPDCD